MPTVTASVEVDATAEETWEAAVDWPGQSQWVLASSVAATSGGGRGASSTVEARTGIGRLVLRDPMEIVEWDPPHRLRLRHLGKLVKGDAIYEVTRLPDGRSALEWSETLEAPGRLLGALYAVGVPVFGVVIRLSLRRFARWVPNR